MGLAHHPPPPSADAASPWFGFVGRAFFCAQTRKKAPPPCLLTGLCRNRISTRAGSAHFSQHVNHLLYVCSSAEEYLSRHRCGVITAKGDVRTPRTLRVRRGNRTFENHARNRRHHKAAIVTSSSADSAPASPHRQLPHQTRPETLGFCTRPSTLLQKVWQKVSEKTCRLLTYSTTIQQSP